MPEFAPLESQDVREYWEHEARDFTPWLARQIGNDQISDLEDTLGLDLEVEETEKSVGRYDMDILAEIVDDNRNVVIENQLKSSDHDHLGKSIAYASGVDADIIVWIAPQFSDEHRDAMQWLNENSREGVDLFAIRLEVWKIADSDPAVRLNPVVEPSEWKTKAQRGKDEQTDTERLREEFWTAFRDHLEDVKTPLSARKPSSKSYYNNPIGTRGFELTFTIKATEDELEVALVIKDDPGSFFQLTENKNEINSQFEEELYWKEPEQTRSGKERSKIIVQRDGKISDEGQWDSYHEWMVATGEKFHQVFYDRIQQL